MQHLILAWIPNCLEVNDIKCINEEKIFILNGGLDGIISFLYLLTLKTILWLFI